MTCAKTQKFIPSFVNGEINERQRREVEEHVSACAVCRAVAAQYAELARLAHSLPQPNEPPDFYDNFLQEIMAQVSPDTQPTNEIAPRRWAWSPLRPRYALIGAGVLAVVLLIGFLFSKSERRQKTLEAYLIQRDFPGLAQALTNPQQRPTLMNDSVAVDLLVESLELLDLIHHRHGQAGAYLAHFAATVFLEGQNMPATSAGEQNLRQAAGLRHSALLAARFDFKTAIRKTKSLKRWTAKVTLKELVKSWTYSL
jgi:hypothetical protein